MSAHLSELFRKRRGGKKQRRRQERVFLVRLLPCLQANFPSSFHSTPSSVITALIISISHVLSPRVHLSLFFFFWSY